MIPKIFHSDLDEAPIQCCSLCNRSLVDEKDPVPYIVEKAFQRYEGQNFKNTVFEIAICMPCAEQTRSTMSKESMENIEAYLTENLRPPEQHLEIPQNEAGELDLEALKEALDELIAKQGDPVSDDESWMLRCSIKGTPIEELKEYQIVGHFEGNDLSAMGRPLLIGGEALDEMQELLSEKTREEMDGLMGDIGVPPELRELLIDHPMVLM